MNLENIILRETPSLRDFKLYSPICMTASKGKKPYGQKADGWLSGTRESNTQGLEGTFGRWNCSIY